jgi:hypothetical protein
MKDEGGTMNGKTATLVSRLSFRVHRFAFIVSPKVLL